MVGDEPASFLDDLDVSIPDSVLREDAANVEGLSSPEFLGPYQLIQEIGVGGVAKVIRARHIHPHYADTAFAVKILHEELSSDPKVQKLFRNEAYVLAILNHKNIVKTFEAGVLDEKLFIAMEYIDGRDLDEMMIRCRYHHISIPIPLALHFIGEVLTGLVFAHELVNADGQHLNLVHRDVNPANVFLSYNGGIKLGDFGVAAIIAGRLEKNKELAGKLGYFAPEQLMGQSDIDTRTDVFAVGVMLHEILCGERLFGGDDADEIMRKNKRAKIPKPSKMNAQISPHLEQIILKALHRKPNERFQTAREMLLALKPFLPDALSMTLAVAAFMRKIFLREHIQELQLREGLAGAGPWRGSGQLVALFSKEERAQTAFQELLRSRGYRMEIHKSCETLIQSTGRSNPPNLLLVDVDSEGFSASDCVNALNMVGCKIPVVAISESLSAQAIQAANTIRAEDLLFKPFNIERVLTAVRATITGATKASLISEPNFSKEDTFRQRLKLLIISSEPNLIVELSSALADYGFDIDVSPNATEAIERTAYASYHMVVLDACPSTSFDMLFASKFRGQAGMGIVPVIYLTTEADKERFDRVAVDRSAVHLRSENSAELITSINHLCQDNSSGRSFVRYDISCPVELRFGGRGFKGTSINISRSGISIHADVMPAINSSVNVVLKPPILSEAIEVNGRVMRVELTSETIKYQSLIGVAFEKFVRQGETNLIKFVESLDQSISKYSTMILEVPNS